MKQTNFTQWLHTATRRLPPDIREEVRAEFRAHYEDALETYLEDGLTPEMAHEAALTDLGDAGAAAQALLAIHQAQAHYLRAAFASMAPSLLMLGGLLIFTVFFGVFTALLGTHDMRLLFETLIFGVLWVGLALISIYSNHIVLKSLKQLTGVYGYKVDLPARLIIWGMLALVIPMIITALVPINGLTYPRIMILNDPLSYYYLHFNTTSLGVYAMALYAGGFIGVVGLGWLLLGLRLDRHRACYFGLSLPMSAMCVLSGFSLIMMALTFHIVSLFFWIVLAVIVGPVKMGVFTLLFVRAARQEPSPTLFA
ncbi:MAG: hypothetical protein OHK0046_16370 [Anaerolineae bacterium]